MNAPSELRADESLVELRCSVIVMRGDTYLLVQRTSTDDWVLPGGRPRGDESMVACARREAREETGLDVMPTRCALVLEVADPLKHRRVVELVFVADARDDGQALIGEAGGTPQWVSRTQLPKLTLRPPIAGYLRNLSRGERRTAAYLGNLWRPGQPASWASDAWAGGE